MTGTTNSNRAAVRTNGSLARSGRRGFRTLAAAGGAVLFAIACGSGGDQADGEVSVSTGADNALIAVLDIATDESDILVEVTSDETETRTISSTSDGDNHLLKVVGLRAETTYQFNVSTAGGAELGSPMEHTTGALPEGAPSVEIIDAVESGESSVDGITFFGEVATGGRNTDTAADPNGPTYWGIDSAGEVVWYLANSDAPNNPVIRDLGGGEILVFQGDSVDRMTVGGDLISSFDLSGVRGWHHDVRLMPDGGVVLLGRENQEIDGTDTVGDTIVRLDAEGSTIFEWSSFEHLDLSLIHI